MTEFRSYRGQAGFTLLEALVAFLVVAFGMLAIAGFQITLSRNSDLAKQRTEAMRLAQEKLEQIRAYISTTTVTAFDWNDLPAGGSVQTDTPTVVSNTSFSRSWVLDDTSVAAGSGVAAYRALQRTVQVSVNWTDRAGESQSVVLNSVISRTDPTDVGGLNVPTVENGILRRPKGRDINIPIPATKLGGENTGRSTLSFGNSTLVFSDASGDVVYNCNSSVTVTDNTNLASTSGCTPTTAYLVTGYLSSSGALPTAISIRTQFVSGTAPNGSAVALDVSGTPQCIWDVARDQSSSASPPPVIPNYNAFVCLVTPTNHSAPTAPATLPPAGLHWSGKMQLTTSNASSISSKVCRYGYQPSSTATTVDNSRHPPTYMYVNETLDNQNFLLQQSGNCPSGTIELQSSVPAGCTAAQLVSGSCP